MGYCVLSLSLHKGGGTCPFGLRSWLACLCLELWPPSASASAGDPYGGFGPSERAATQEIGSDPDNAAPAPDDDQTLPWLQQQSQNQQDSYSGAWDQQGAVDDGSDMDDASGH